MLTPILPAKEADVPLESKVNKKDAVATSDWWKYAVRQELMSPQLSCCDAMERNLTAGAWWGVGKGCVLLPEPVWCSG